MSQPVELKTIPNAYSLGSVAPQKWAQEDILRAYQEGMNSVVILRHAERPMATIGTFGGELTLTPAGRVAAKELGKTLSEIRLMELHTSPILRCVQTSEELLQGAGQSVDIRVSKILGDPGPFTEVPEIAGSIFLERSLTEIAQMIVEGKEIPGMRSLKKGSELFLKYALKCSTYPVVMVTHDIIICLLVCFLFESKEVDRFMPPFLGGFSIAFNENQLVVRCGNEVRYLSRHCD